jgi:1,4-dihydroxy-2-naphthoate octaprenyltransferase
MRGWEVLIFAGIALVLGLAYAGPPLRLSYHGLGELIVGIIFGPLVVGAAFYVAVGYITPLAWWLPIPMGLLVANVLNAHAIMDFGPDKAANRITFSILLGSQQRGYMANIVMMVLAYAAILLGVLLGQLPFASLLAFITLPLAFAFTKSLAIYVRCVTPIKEGKWSAEQAEAAKRAEAQAVAAFFPQKWMGPFGNWDRIKSFGIDWFMMRWLLSRNIVMEMVPLLALASLTPWYLEGLPWI